MPCSRAYLVNSAVLWTPNLRITSALWKATVLPEMLRITRFPSRDVLPHQLHHFPLAHGQFAGGPPGPSGLPGESFKMSFFIKW